MTEPTNDAVSDERLREIEAWAELVSTFPKAENHPPPKDYADIASICRELIDRRSVTSQASEGEVVAWQGDAPDGRRGLTSNSKVAEMWKDVGRTVTPLYASPVSKRVERLETKS